MIKEVNRRNWLKTSMAAAAGLATISFDRQGLAIPSEAAVKKTFPMLPHEEATKEYLDTPKVTARLSSNENPFGPSKNAKKALFEAVDDSFLYPQSYRQKLVKLIAKEEGVTPDHILLGAGSSELLDAAAKVYSENNGKVLSADPTYASLVRSAERYGAEWIKIPLTKDCDHDLEKMEGSLKSDISLVYLVNPNNPTGKIIPVKEMKDFCATVSSKVPVFVDEAYIDYMDNAKEASMTQLVREGKNIIVARTFSKVHAFAGLRVGYCIAQPEVIEQMSFHGPRNTLSGPSMNAAAASYVDHEFIKYSVKKNQEGKEYVYNFLKEMGYDYLTSYTNFILFPIHMDGDAFRSAMMQKGVSLKTWKFHDQTWCRVSMGKMDDLKLFTKAFSQIHTLAHK